MSKQNIVCGPGAHQLLPSLEPEDAIGNYALSLRGFLREMGFESRIFVYAGTSGGPGEALPYSRHPRHSSPDNLLIFHTAIGSPLAEYFASCPDRKILVHHNVTPARFFAPWDREVAYLAHLARNQLELIAPLAAAAVADSPYNRQELLTLGSPDPEVIPLIFDWERLAGPADPEVLEKYGDGRTNILFVGRVAPNKRPEDLIRVFYYYLRDCDPAARLILVGEDQRFPVYRRALEKLVRDLGLTDVIFAGKVSLPQLRAYYQTASLFLCLSEHEGLGVPLVESLYYRIPVIAYAAAAVPSTLAGSGVLIREKDPLRLALLLHRIITDPQLREAILQGQDRRLKYFQSFPYRKSWETVVRSLTGHPNQPPVPTNS